MTQIKLSIAFVLAAAAIAPIVAQPIGEGHEFAGHVGHRRHHHHHHHRRPILEQQTPQTNLDDAAPQPSRREFEDEFEARGLLFGQNGDLNLIKSLEHQDAILENKHKSLEAEDRHLEHQNRHLRHKERHLEHKDHRLEREDRKLEHKKHSLERQDKSLLDKKHHLQRDDNKLEHIHKSLEAQDKSLEHKHSSLEHKNKALHRKDKKLALKGKALAHKNEKLEHKGEVLAHHDKVLAKEGKILAHQDKVLAHKGKVLAHHDKVIPRKGHALAPIIVDREYTESDEMFERSPAEGESSAKVLRRPFPRPRRSPYDTGPVTPFTRPRRSPFGRPFFGHGPVVFPQGPHRPIFGRPGPIRTAVEAREFTESDEMFERSPAEEGESGAVSAKAFRRPFHFGPGPVIPFARPRRSPFGLGPIVPPFKRPFGGHGPVVIHRPHRPIIGRPGPIRAAVEVREYADSEDMFERDFEDVEFDARDFDDELYLD